MAPKFSGLELFNGCGKRDIRTIDSLATSLTFAAGRTITADAASGRQLILVCSGTAVVDHAGGHATTAGAGEVVTTVEVEQGTGPMAVHAMTDCDVLVFDRREFRDLEHLVPRAAARLRAAGLRLAAVPAVVAPATVAAAPVASSV